MQREQSPSWVGPLAALAIVLILIGLAVVLAWTIGAEDEESGEAAATAPAVAAAAPAAGSAPQAPPSPAAVRIQNFAYSPTPLSVPAGTRVTWTQLDPVPHTVTSGVPGQVGDGSVFDDTLSTVNATFSFTFDTPGNFAYFCRFHVYMLASVTVTGAPVAGAATPAPAPVVQATPAPYVPPANARQIATGLLAPRGFTFGPDGAIYVAETGTPPGAAPSPTPAPAQLRAGGAVLCQSYAASYDPQNLPPGCPRPQVTGAAAAIVNNNVRISRIDPATGQRTTVVDNLPVVVSIFGDTIGPNSLAFIGNDLYLIISAGPTRGQPDWPTGVYRANGSALPALLMDTAAFNMANPVQFLPPDYNFGLPYDMVALGGKLYISDGNANQVYVFDPAAPAASQLSRLADLSQGHPVATGIAAGSDGNLYVTTFTNALVTPPYPVGGGKILRITPQGQVTELTSGLTLAAGLAVAPDGSFYVAEFGRSLGKAPFVAPPGRIVRLPAGGGTAQQVASPFIFPTVMRFGPDGRLYTTNYSVDIPGDATPRGGIFQVTLP